MYSFPFAVDGAPFQNGEIPVWNSSTKQWVAQSAVVQAATDWYVDAINGNDNNIGTNPQFPLESLLELQKRIGSATLMAPVLIHILSDLPAGDRFFFQGFFGAPDIYIHIIGESQKELATVIATGVTNIVVNSTRPSVQVAGFNWTPYVGKRVRVIASSGSTPIGTVFWIEKVDTNPEIAFISQPFVISWPTFIPYGRKTLLVGDTLVIEELTKCGLVGINTITTVNQQFSLGMILENIEFNNEDAFSSLEMINGTAFGCNLNMRSFRGSFIGFACKCKATPPFTTQEWETLFSQSYLYASSIQGNLLIQGPAPFVLTENSSIQSSSLTCESISMFRIANQGGTGTSVWDWSGFALNFDELAGGFLEGRLWGSSLVANSQAIRIRSQSRVIYLSSSKPTADGASANDVTIGGTAMTYASLTSFINSTNGAALVVWA